MSAASKVEEATLAIFSPTRSGPSANTNNEHTRTFSAAAWASVAALRLQACGS